MLAFWAGKDAVCAIGFGSEATATSCGIRNLCVWQKVSGSERLFTAARPDKIRTGGEWMNYRCATLWLARLALAVVFCLNVSCALAFVARPEAYAPGFEVSGVPGEALVRGIGFLFLMWNVTYPLAIWRPYRYRWLFLIIVVQQAIGLAGETWMLLTLPPAHAALAATGYRFVAFDGGGFVAMLVTFTLMQRCAAGPTRPGPPGAGCA